MQAVKDQLPRLGKRKIFCLLSFTCNHVVSVLERFPLPLSAWNGLRYFIVALPGSSIYLLCIISNTPNAVPPQERV